MARTLYLDCFAGASGDMLIGALLDCGLDFEQLKTELGALGVAGFELSLDRVDRAGISAAKFDVHFERPQPEEIGYEVHAHDLPHPHEAEPDPQSGHRALSEIKRMIAASQLSTRVQERAQTIFERIGVAESKIHNVPIETVHFHEVGAIDSIVDIIGACIGLDALGIDRVLSSPLHVGFGTFRCAHGIYPVPGPATTELLRGVPIYSKDVEGELVTPTGAAIIATLAESYGPMPLMRIDRVGYGAGTRTYPKFPNVLRAVIGEIAADAHDTASEITVIEANLDDTSAQVLGYVMEAALAAGALELFYTPVQMKKNRPGVLLTLLCQPTDCERMCALLFRETTTLGVRYRQERRAILQREFATVATQFGPIQIKLARDANGALLNSAPEFDDCRRAAQQHNVAVRTVQLAAALAYAQQHAQ